jgi:hypothetical protein
MWWGRTLTKTTQQKIVAIRVGFLQDRKSAAKMPLDGFVSTAIFSPSNSMQLDFCAFDRVQKTQSCYVHDVN